MPLRLWRIATGLRPVWSGEGARLFGQRWNPAGLAAIYTGTSFALYCERNLIERFFNKLKHFRAIATRYDKLAKIFLAGVHLACAAILLN